MQQECNLIYTPEFFQGCIPQLAQGSIQNLTKEFLSFFICKRISNYVAYVSLMKLIKKMASSVCWSYDHMLNEIKTNPAMLYEYKKNIYNYEQHSKTDL